MDAYLGFPGVSIKPINLQLHFFSTDGVLIGCKSFAINLLLCTAVRTCVSLCVVVDCSIFYVPLDQNTHINHAIQMLKLTKVTRFQQKYTRQNAYVHKDATY